MGFIDDIFSRGNSGRKNILSAGEAYLVTFNLSGKSSLEKVKFCQALFGRKGGGTLEEARGKKLGQGCVLVPADGIGNIEAFMGERKVRIQKQKILLVE